MGILAKNGAHWAGAVLLWAATAAGAACAAIPWDKGDMNCSGDVNTFDIDGFILALCFPEAYPLEYPDCDINNADINDDGPEDNCDIDPFRDLLTGGESPENGARGNLHLILSHSNTKPGVPSIPYLDEAGTLYIWAAVDGAVWNGLSLYVVTTYDATASGELYNPWYLGGALTRWEGDSSFVLDPDGNAIALIESSAKGLGNTFETVVDGYILVGELHVGLVPGGEDGFGKIYLAVGPQCITRLGGTCGSDTVVFGPSDAPVPGNNPGAASANPEAYIITEYADCNDNGEHDGFDLGDCDSSVWCSDCNDNGVLDSCDIDPADPDGNGEVSEDTNGNGIPDECEMPIPAVSASGMVVMTLLLLSAGAILMRRRSASVA
ncbi:MAG: hypothetical protein KKB50_12780 [Planctomycetes bacterium]|nr:hypothetical protein [Planctomycetota bacterium]